MKQVKELINEVMLQKRVREIAEEIKKDYHGKTITLICILKGSTFFTADLARYLQDENVILEFIRVSSYGSGTESTGEIKMKLDLKDSIQGKDVIVIEDIIDTGRTLAYLLDYLRLKNPNSLKLCALLSKPSRRILHVDTDYIGFEVPDKFIVGYGMDYNEEYRHIPYIGCIED